MLDAVLEIFLWLLGLCIGSFLNVVVYRLPAGLSIADPPRSFCPGCRGPIAWYDNLPLASWLALGGRCRRCRIGISVQYPLVEGITGLAFVMVYHLLFVARSAVGPPLTLPADVPILASWLALIAGLIACAAMDIASYTVDVRVTNLVIAAGILLHGAWGNAGAQFIAQASTPYSAAAVAAFGISGLMLLVWELQRQDDVGNTPAPADPPASTPNSGPTSSATADMSTTPPAPADAENATLPAAPPTDPMPPTDNLSLTSPAPAFSEQTETVPAQSDSTSVTESSPSGASPPSPVPPDLSPSLGVRIAGVFAVLVLAGLAAAFICTAAGATATVMARPLIAATLLAAFAAIVLTGGQERAADLELKEALAEEEPHARRVALQELAWLAPAILGLVAAFLAVAYWTAAQTGWNAVVQWSPAVGFAPLAGVTWAVKGLVIGAAAGWTLRIVFTLAYGREAFGVGDIYILAMAGATAGWDIALLGLLFSVGIALAGWALGLALKRTVMIPFGPWLALGFVLALIFNQPAHRIAGEYADSIATGWREQPHMVLVGLGMICVATALAILFSRLLRRAVVPENAPEPEESDKVET